MFKYFLYVVFVSLVLVSGVAYSDDTMPQPTISYTLSSSDGSSVSVSKLYGLYGNNYATGSISFGDDGSSISSSTEIHGPDATYIENASSVDGNGNPDSISMDDSIPVHDSIPMDDSIQVSSSEGPNYGVLVYTIMYDKNTQPKQAVAVLAAPLLFASINTYTSMSEHKSQLQAHGIAGSIEIGAYNQQTQKDDEKEPYNYFKAFAYTTEKEAVAQVDASK